MLGQVYLFIFKNKQTAESKQTADVRLGCLFIYKSKQSAESKQTL